MSITKLSDIPGVGEKVRKALIQHFGNERVALKVILDSRVDLVAAVPGLGSKQAVNIIKGAFEIQFGASSNMLLRSPDARKIYDSILDIIRGYANTIYARDKLVLYFPLPPEKINVIHERQRYFADAAEMARLLTKEQREMLCRNLSRIRGLYKRIPPKRIEGRVILTNDESVFDRLVEAGVDRWCPVYILSEGDNATDYAQGFDFVLFISPHGVYDETLDLFDNVEIIGKDWSINDVLPERTIGFYARNYHVIDSACRLAEVFDSLPTNDTVKVFTESIDLEKLRRVGELLSQIDESGDVAQGIDESLDRYRNAVKIFPTAIAEIESWINDEITARIAKSEITLGGQQIISILQSADMEGADAGTLRNMLPAEIIETFSTTIQEAEDRLAQMLGLTAREADWITGIVSEEIALPVRMAQQQINSLEDRLRQMYAERRFRLIKGIARELDSLRDVVNKAVQTLLEFDLFLAVGLFAADYDLHIPDVSMDYEGVAIIKARNLFLMDSLSLIHI